MSRIIVFDIDGTLANIEHRRHFVRGDKKHWSAFNREMVNDTPYEDIIWLMEALSYQTDVKIVIASGRGEEDREKTANWLAENGIYRYKDHEGNLPVDLSRIRVCYMHMFMRPAKDSRKDSIIKKEILERIIAEYGDKPFMVFDDRNQVVDMWRENGIRCLQVAPGDF